MNEKLRRITRFWLIKLANFIGGKDYFDFGEEIISTVVFKDLLITSTKNSIYSWDGQNRWTKVSKKLEK